MSADRWPALRTDDGSWTLRHPGHGEACHSRSGAWEEARRRYAEACRLRERGLGGELRELRLLDVGTGLGWNLAAALAALEGTGVTLEAVTLERDPAVVEATLELARRGAFRDVPGERHHAPVRAALARALVRPGERVALGDRGDGLQLELGEASHTLARLEPGFDAVFLDLFSPKNDPGSWDAAVLAPLAGSMRPGSWLSTYCAAFAVRLTLARCGLAVGRGAAVGAKAEGTLASPDRVPPALRPAVEARLRRALQKGRGRILGVPLRERPAAID